MGASIEIGTILVPVDGSDESARAVEYAVAIAERYDAGVHLMYVLDETAARSAANGEPADDWLVSSEAIDPDFGSGLEGPGTVPITHSVAVGYSTQRLTVHPGSVVLDAADQMSADFIVIPRERGDTVAVLEKAAEYVLQYASQPTLTV